MICHSYRGVHIPGCMGCAAVDHDNCTCTRYARDRYGNDANLANNVTALEKRVAALEGLLANTDRHLAAQR